MLKNFTFLSLFVLTVATAFGQGTMTFTTSADTGTEISLVPKPQSATQSISIDWGDGNVTKHTVKPNASTSQRKITGIVAGSTITVTADLTELQFTGAHLTSATVENMSVLTKLDLKNNELTTFKLLTVTPLKELDLTGNRLTNSPSQAPTLSLENCSATLTKLTLNQNDGLTCLDMRNLKALQTLTIKECPQFSSLYICSPEEEHTALRTIYITNCALSHFYPVSLPALKSLDLSGNALNTSTDYSPFTLGDYPELTTLDLNNNKGIDKIDLSNCKKLDKLFIYDCSLDKIDISQCPALSTLNCGGNNISHLDLTANTGLKVLTINDNPIANLDIEPLDKLTTLNISNTNIANVSLRNAYYLETFRAAGSKISFVDFHGTQANKMTTIDLSNCPAFTAASMTYTLRTIRPCNKKQSATNLFLTGSNAEHADTDYATSSDYKWTSDVQGDATATNDPLAVTLADATDTGENKTGTLGRLFPNYALSLDYDLDVMQTTGGKFIICQWNKPDYFTVSSVSTTALDGVPITIYPYPEDGNSFKSVTVNGKEIGATQFIISEPSTIKVNFESELPTVTFDVATGQAMSFLVNTTEANGTVEVDWGNGARIQFTGQNMYKSGTVNISGTRIKGTAAGEKVTLYGNIAAIDVYGYGDMATELGLWDNHITGADLTKCPELKLFNAHWNPISTIDLSKNTALEILDLSFTKLSSIDLSANTKLMYLAAYSDGFGTGDISMLNSVDVSGLPNLQVLNLKNNKIAAIDLSANPRLGALNLNGNLLSSIDLSHNTMLQTADLSRNSLTSLDVSENTALIELAADYNLLSAIDLSHNTALKYIYLGNNAIKDFDFSPLKALQRISITGNGLTADQLSDIYYRLPRRVDDGSDQSQLFYNILVYQSGDATPNEATLADSSIAEDRDWIPSHSGSNSGCETAYLDIIKPVNGTITVTDASGKVYANGSKVPKYEALTIIATPAEGYKYQSYSLNGETPIEAATFEMPGIYTKLSANFAKDSSAGLDTVGNDSVSVTAVDGGIEISASHAAADVYTAAGIRVLASEVDGTAFFPLPAGYYIVRVGAHTQSVIVK